MGTDLDSIPKAGPYANSKLIQKGQLTSILVSSKHISFLCPSLLIDAEVDDINDYEAVIQDVVILLTFRVDL